MNRLCLALVLVAGFSAALLAGCTTVAPLSAQRGSTIVVAVGSVKAPPVPIGYGNKVNIGAVTDYQRGWLNYYLDAPANALVTRATSAVAAAPASELAQDPSTNPEGGLGQQVVSTVAIPATAPVGPHSLYVRNCTAYPIPANGTCPNGAFNGPGVKVGDINVMPATVQFTENSVSYSVTGQPTPVNPAVSLSVPNPMLVIPLGVTAHAAEIHITSASNGAALELAQFPPVGPSRVAVVGALETPESVSGRPALAWVRYVPSAAGFGEHVIDVVAGDADGFSEVGLIFQLSNQSALQADEVVVTLHAWNASGVAFVTDLVLDPNTFSIR